MTHAWRLAWAETRSRWRSLVALGGATFVFLLAVAGTYSALGGPTGLAKSFGRQTPAFLSAFAGARHVDLFRPTSYVGFGFGHPLFLVLTFSVGISIGTAAVAADIETGRAEMLYVRPIPRTLVLDTRLAVWAGAQVAIVLAGTAGSLLGTRLSTDLRPVHLGLYPRVVVQYLPLAAVFGALAFAASARSSSRGHALGVSIGATALAYLVNFVALLWHPMAWAQRVTPFGYYAPVDAVGRIDTADVLVLTLTAIALVTVARWSVQHRDLV